MIISLNDIVCNPAGFGNGMVDKAGLISHH
jgi:hypothetical protein